MAMEKTFNASEAEARLYQAWDEAGCFKAGKHVANAETSSFCIMIPPPNVTGSLHMGHAFNNTLQDILVRWHRMRGFDTLWQPGQDHAGIATQMVVERELAQTNRRRTDFSREEFVDLVWEQKKKSGGKIIEQLKRLGASCDWSRNAFTMAGAPGDSREGHENSPDFHAAVMKAFVDMYNDGIIYRGKRLVNWDPKFETAISDLEVENIETPGHMWHFKYPLAGGKTYTYVEKDEDGNVTLEETRDYISIATTRPETMLGDGAVAVHPEDTRYAPIVGALCEIPVGPKEQRRLIPIITDEYPDPDFGSGAVKITGAHDFNDYGVAKRNGIPLYRLMDTVAAMRADGLSYVESASKATELRDGAEMSEAEVDQINLVPEEYRGLDRFEARKKVVEEITAEGLAVMETVTKTDKESGEETTETRPLVEAKPIMQPFGDRSKTVIEPMLTDQWFVDAVRIVQPAIDAVRNSETKILPERDEKVYFHWLENIEPWCISRQLWWGHQVPVWYGPSIASKEAKTVHAAKVDWQISGGVSLDYQTPKMFCAPNFEDACEQAKRYYGDLAQFGFIEADDLLPRRYEDYGDSIKVQLMRDPDVLDTWFSSGLWPLGTLGWPEETEELKKYFPTNTLVTGFDIIFFWVARMMMMQYAMVGQKPFDTVYVHALVRDEKGQKMSKSLGNVIDPLTLIDEYGADAVRFTLTAMAAMGRDLKLSKQRVEGYRNFGTKLWNACRFAEMNEVYENAGTPNATHTVNTWILGETAKVRETVDEALTNYRFNDAANALYAFVWGKVCDWYVEFSKPLLQGEDAAAKAECQSCMAWVLDQCLIMLHPIMPFVTEELWENLTDRKGQKLMLQEWPSYTSAEMLNTDADAEMNWVITFIEAIRSARAQMNVPASARIPVVGVALDAETQARLKANANLIERLARVDSFSEASEAPKGAIAVNAGSASFALPLADIIDVAKETARLEKNLGKLEKEIGGLKGRVNNPKFVASAPPEVVEEAKANLTAREGEAQVVKNALDRLKEL